MSLLDPGKHRESFMSSSTGPEIMDPTQSDMVTSTTSSTTSSGSKQLRRPPKFTSQIPHLTIRPGTEAILDVELESSSPVK